MCGRSMIHSGTRRADGWKTTRIGGETTRFEASGDLKSPWVCRGVVSGDGEAETVAGPLQRGVACVRYPRPPAARGGCKQLVRASWCVLGYNLKETTSSIQPLHSNLAVSGGRGQKKE